MASALPFISPCRRLEAKPANEETNLGAADGELSAPQCSEPNMSHTKPLTILVVDDDEGHRELIRRNLLRGGLTNTVVALPTGNAALEYVFCRGAYADRKGDSLLLMLLDINMPGLDGAEVLRQIKADPVKKKIPIIMLTTTDDPREVNRCYELGCNEYISKPVEPVAFIETIKRLGMFLSVVSIVEES